MSPLYYSIRIDSKGTRRLPPAPTPGASIPYTILAAQCKHRSKCPRIKHMPGGRDAQSPSTIELPRWIYNDLNSRLLGCYIGVIRSRRVKRMFLVICYLFNPLLGILEERM